MVISLLSLTVAPDSDSGSCSGKQVRASSNDMLVLTTCALSTSFLLLLPLPLMCLSVSDNRSLQRFNCRFIEAAGVPLASRKTASGEQFETLPLGVRVGVHTHLESETCGLCCMVRSVVSSDSSPSCPEL